jgi:hypothetical protein
MENDGIRSNRSNRSSGQTQDRESGKKHLFHRNSPSCRAELPGFVRGNLASMVCEGQCGLCTTPCWSGIFGSSTGGLLDRLTQDVHTLEMNGDSYRLKQSKHRQHTRARVCCSRKGLPLAASQRWP